MTLDVEVATVTGFELEQLMTFQKKGLFNLREADKKECLAIGLTPEKAIESCVRNSLASFVVMVDGNLVATWGYSTKNPLSGIGYPWLLTTPLMLKYKVFFARRSLHCRDFLLTRFNRLEVLVAAEYLQAQEWLEWLDFQSSGPAITLNWTPFIHMYLERK